MDKLEAVEVLRDPLEYGLRHNFKLGYNDAVALAVSAIEYTRWKSAENEPPKSDGHYLVKGSFAQFVVEVALFRNKEGKWINGHELDGVTHWTQLPE